MVKINGTPHSGRPMARPLGPRQLEVLLLLASPTTLLLTPDHAARSLVGRGLLARERLDCEALRITPAGLRQLADEMEAGRLPAAIERIKARVAAQRRAIAARRAARTPADPVPPDGTEPDWR